MSDEYYLDKMGSWLGNHPLVVFVVGIFAFIIAFTGLAQYQAVSCLVSGIFNTFTGLTRRFQAVSLGKIASMGQLLTLIGMWAGVIGLVNIDGNPSIFLPYTSFATGSVAIAAFFLVRIKR